ncbi:transcription elongation factor GreA [Candidatus Gracilibacteria bacterium]|nr:transcription elongation factor GreA [Candidatus Gracilibacteria bacterium]MCF7856454.1 transcription elongation factor GreA [Candidatus Gracilibacteria bacterium]MCF7896551.1 transcription elongation factor GreA [Candidatus Gracilibacteria bacterium]
MNDSNKKEVLTEEDLTLSGQSTIGNDDDDDDNTGEDDTTDDKNDDTVGSDDSQQTLVTRDGLKNLKDELENLEGVKRKEVAQRLKEAISFGDLSENSEYEDAKNEQALTEGRIAELKRMIKTAKIITEKKSGGKIVKIGSTVTIQNLTEKDEAETYTIVGSTEADPIAAKISNESPIGAAIVDQDQGAEVMVETPAGTMKYKIVNVS